MQQRRVQLAQLVHELRMIVQHGQLEEPRLESHARLSEQPGGFPQQPHEL